MAERVLVAQGLLSAVRSEIVTRIAWIVLFVVTGAAITWFRTRHMTEASALYGFSPSALIDPVWGRPDFAADFPNGEAQTLNSLVGQIYRLLGAIPLSDRVLVTAMVFAEFCTLGIGAYVAGRSANPRLPAFMAAGASLLLTAGTLISCDLSARWFHPVYSSSYNFAYGVGLLAFAAILNSRPVWAGLAVGVTAAIHPIIGMFFGMAVGLAALVRLPQYRLTTLVAGGALALVIAGGWAWAMLGDAGVSGAAVDPRMYIALTRMMSSHWFPVSLGVFGGHAYETLIPFAGFMALTAVLLRPWSRDGHPADAQIAVAILFLVVLSFLGAMASEYSGIPLLVKLALHRASSIALLLGAIVIAPRLIGALMDGSVASAALAAALLLLPYWRDHGPPILLCVIFAALVLMEDRHRRPRAELILAGAATGLAAIVIVLFAHSPAMPVVLGNANLGIGALRDPLFVVAFAVLIAARFLRMPAVAALGLLTATLVWAPQMDLMRDPAEIAKARRYLEVQQWAHDNTPPGTLFMLDPNIAYGWREYSERPSFGTLREWLYSGWIYDTRADVFQQGLDRARALGIDPDRYIALDAQNPGAGYAAMWQDAARLYYSKPPQWYAEMTAKYGIAYFVLDKSRGAALPELEIPFENDRFTVVKAP